MGNLYYAVRKLLDTLARATAPRRVDRTGQPQPAYVTVTVETERPSQRRPKATDI